MSALPLTAAQRQMALLIEAGIKANGRSPTIRELMVESGIASTNGVACHLDALRRKGYLGQEEYKARGIRLTAAWWLLRESEGVHWHPWPCRPDSRSCQRHMGQGAQRGAA